MLRTLVFATLLAALFAFGAAPARAFEDYQETRVLGMGGASRAFAIGGAGPLINPSGMSLAKTYTVEGGYEYAHQFSDNFLHASVVDSTSEYNIAGGLYYTYHFSDRAGAVGHGHEAGLAISLPFGEIMAMGATVKYTRLSGWRARAGRRLGLDPADDEEPACGGGCRRHRRVYSSPQRRRRVALEPVR